MISAEHRTPGSAPVGGLRAPLIVAIGGTTRRRSSTERALAQALQAAEAAGATTMLFGGEDLARLPAYAAESDERTDEQQRLVDAVRRCDGLLIGTPGYHGGVSGLVKNALDLLQDLANDARPYLDGRAVGCVVTAYGVQACGTTLVALRSIVHGLRGWPTPLGVVLNGADPAPDDGACGPDPRVASQLALMADQVVDFAQRQSGQRGEPPRIMGVA